MECHSYKYGTITLSPVDLIFIFYLYIYRFFAESSQYELTVKAA